MAFAPPKVLVHYTRGIASSLFASFFYETDCQELGESCSLLSLMSMQIKVLKAEMRKGKKRVKKSVKVQEFTATTPAPMKGQAAVG